MLLFPLCVIFLSSTASLIDGLDIFPKCPKVRPMRGFNMDKFVGKWYGIQKSDSDGKCITYNIEKTKIPGKYRVEQVKGPADERESFTGDLEYTEEDKQADMTANFPGHHISKSSFVVFTTDYDTYAGIYTCKKKGPYREKDATILSRRPTLSQEYIDKVRGSLSAVNMNEFDMYDVDRKNCMPEKKE